MHPRPPARVWLAISSFRNDDAVSKLLEEASSLVPTLFERALVVDSLGTGAIPKLIQRRGWDFVQYESADVNLGSAGNLARRMTVSAAAGADYVYALNHDGELLEETVRKLVEAGQQAPQLAVLYPLRRLRNRGGKFDVTGRLRWPLPRIAVSEPPSPEVFDVYWGSSNGTLYSLEPVRSGLVPWADFWMGHEDLGYGWLLAAHGYRQVVVRGAVFDDPYEFRELVGGMHRTDKAAWYSYYFARNLLLIGQRTQQPLPMLAALAARIALEGLVSATLRPDRAQRLRLLCRGVVDGLAGKSGFRQAPS
jgi:hypothetical protein